MKLVDFAWNTAISISGRNSSSLRLVLDERLDRPILSGSQDDFLIKLALPRAVRENLYSLYGIYFDSEGFGWASMWRFFKASLYHASLHVAYSDFQAYSSWFKKKEDGVVAMFCVSAFDDYSVTMRAAKHWPGLLGDIAFSNYISALSVGDPNVLEDAPLRFATKLLLRLWGVNGFSTHSVREDQRTEGLAADLSRTARLASSVKPVERQGAVENSLNQLYAAIEECGRLGEVPSFPYIEGHGQSTIVNSELLEETTGGELLRSAYSAMDVTTRPEEDEARALKDSEEFSTDVMNRASRKRSLEEIYKRALSGTMIESIEIPVADYGMFLRTRAELSGPIRSIRDRLSTALNEEDEDLYYNSGQVDTQLAMQVIASKQKRTDVFVRSSLMKKNEAWAIILDASKSLMSFESEVRGIAVCLAEVADKLMLVPEQWALFGFNDRLLILKDFSEKYGVESKARIGGLAQKHSTFLPDAIFACYRRLVSVQAGTKIMVVVSDGHPIGYPDIEENLTKAVKTVTGAGIPLVGVGFESPEITKYFRTNCVLEGPYQLMKFFVKAYMEIAS